MKTDNELISMKLTKKALNKFIIWSTSRYNSYLDFGTKAQNVSLVFNSLKKGFYCDKRGNEKTDKTVFQIECSQGNGEGQGYRYWRLKGRKGDYIYEIDCINKTVKGMPSGNLISFYNQQAK